jgi:hypothetical protein
VVLRPATPAGTLPLGPPLAVAAQVKQLTRPFNPPCPPWLVQGGKPSKWLARAAAAAVLRRPHMGSATVAAVLRVVLLAQHR